MRCVLFTDKTISKIDGPTVGQMFECILEMTSLKVYDVNNRMKESSCRLVSLEAVVFGPLCVRKGVKATSAAFCNLLKEVFDPLIDYIDCYFYVI